MLLISMGKRLSIHAAYKYGQACIQTKLASNAFGLRN